MLMRFMQYFDVFFNLFEFKIILFEFEIVFTYLKRKKN